MNYELERALKETVDREAATCERYDRKIEKLMEELKKET